MIGDHPTNDVAGGMRAGMAGVYYNPKFHSLETAFAELTERPNYTINSLSELNDLL
jgi:FMN phosphatase YigB (HAD superfamily)